MSELKNKLEGMRGKLSEYYLDPEFRGSKKLYDIERRTTRFYRVLLNEILKLNLILADPLDDRYSFLDLIDLAGETAVVITPCATQAKRSRTMRNLEDGDPEHRVKRLVFLSTENNPEITEEIASDNLEQTKVEFWDFDQLVRQAEDVPAEKQYFLMNYLDDWIENDCPTYALEGLPAPCDHFVPGSRDDELANLITGLEKRKPVFVTGVGGIGKTQTVIQLALRAAPRRGAYLIRFKEPENAEGDLLRDTILKANFLNYWFAEKDNAAKDKEYRARMDILRNQYAGAMLVLDNLDYQPKEPYDSQMSLDKICSGPTYEELASMDLQLVITSRSKACNGFSVPIEPLGERNCLKLMEQAIGNEEYREYSEEELCALIDEVGRHTLTVFLMGKMLADGWWTGMTPQKIGDTLKSGSYEDMEALPEVVTDKDQTYEYGTIYTHLRSLFGISNLTERDSTVMRFMSLLPKDGISERLFICGLSQIQNQSMESLIDRGLIQRENSIADRKKTSSMLKLHPMIRMVCRNELKPTGSKCRKFLQLMRANNDPDIIVAKKEIEQLANLFSDVSDQEDPDGRWARVAAIYWTRHGDNEKSLKYNQRALERSSNITNQQDIVTAYNQLANAYYNQGNVGKAMEYQRVALEYQERIPADDLRVAYTYNDLGNIYGSQLGYEVALSYQQKALEIAKKALQNETRKDVRDKIAVDLAKYYSNVGQSFHKLGDDKRALENLLKSLDTFRNHLSDRHPDIARTYIGIGMVFEGRGDHEKALEYRRKVLSIVEQTLPDDHPELARAYSNIGNSFVNLKQYDQALEFQLQGLKIREKMMVPNNLDLAVSYANISATYRALQDHVSALKFQKKALEIREKILPNGHLLIGRCYKNMSISCDALGQHEKAMEYLEKAIEILRRYPEEDGKQIENMEQTLMSLHAEVKQAEQP